MDDKAARNCAASLGVGVIGTIGLILLANKKGHIENPIAYLEKLKKTGFRISDDLFQHATFIKSIEVQSGNKNIILQAAFVD